MKLKFINLKSLLLLLFVSSFINGFSQETFELIQENKKSIEVKFTLAKYVQNEVATEKGNAILFSSNGSSQTQLKGAPALPKFSKSIIIPDKSAMNYKITDSKYIEIEDILIAPSKGVVSREKNIDEIPYLYGEEYNENAFYPQNIMELGDPYILRNHRGQVVNVQPFQYNPVSKTLRVYTNITFEIVEDEDVKSDINVFNRSDEKHLNSEFHEIYKSQFLNYSPESKYTTLEEAGTMLIIAHSDYISAMDDFVTWKNQRGLKTEIVEFSSIGSSANDIKTYVTNYYNSNNLIYLLLIGDAEDIPSLNKSGDSDAAYGHISGTDSYAEVFVGRFSAESVADVETQVERSIYYERDMQKTATWLSKGVVIASDEGVGGDGDDGESDIQHMDNLRTDLLAYNYDLVDQIYDPGASASTVATSVNNGRSLINYVGHGSDYEWVTTGFSTSNVNSLTNENKLPYIFDVACVNGNFHGKTCFAESWMRATNNGNPSGAVAIIASTINQSWASPMDAQDEMIDILTESYASNIKRSFGGVTVNGIMHMIDEYGSDGSNMANTWTIFGDPSLNVRTDAPNEMSISHNSVAYVGSTDFIIDSDEDAVVCLYFNDEILGTGIVDGGTVTITFDAIATPGTIKLTATGYNKVTYVSDIIVSASDSPYIVKESISINDAIENNNGEADFGENLYINMELSNISDIYDAFGVETKITTTDTNVVVVDSVESFGDFSASQNITANSVYHIQLKNKFSDQQQVKFDMQITGKDADDKDYDWSTKMNLVVNAPVLKIGELLIDDSNYNNDGILDAGETAILKLTVSNDGHASISQLSGVLESITGSSLISVTDNITDPISLAIGESKTVEFEISVDGAETTGKEVEFIFSLNDIYDGYYSVTETKKYSIGVPPVYLISDQGTNSLVTAKALFYDSGNATSNYSNGENYTITFKPRSENEKIVAEFLSFNVEKDGSGCYDYLEIYDGENTSAGLIGSYCDASPPTTILSTNSKGSLTFMFYSDGAVDKSGWAAEITSEVIEETSTEISKIDIQEFNIYPNPSNGILNLEISGAESQQYKVKIFDVFGSMVYTRVYTYGAAIKEQIDITNNPKGMYFISIENEKGVLLNRKIIVR